MTTDDSINSAAEAVNLPNSDKKITVPGTTCARCCARPGWYGRSSAPQYSRCVRRAVATDYVADVLSRHADDELTGQIEALEAMFGGEEDEE